MWGLMVDCWHAEPSSRPTISNVLEGLERINFGNDNRPEGKSIMLPLDEDTLSGSHSVNDMGDGDAFQGQPRGLNSHQQLEVMPRMATMTSQGGTHM